MASATASADVASTNDTDTPCASNEPNRLLVLPNRKLEETKWSPRRSNENNMVPMAAMPVPKTHACHPTFHARDFVLQCFNRRVDLPAVREARLAALKNRRQVARVVVPVGDGGVYRLLQAAVLDLAHAVAVNDSGGEAFQTAAARLCRGCYELSAWNAERSGTIRHGVTLLKSRARILALRAPRLRRAASRSVRRWRCSVRTTRSRRKDRSPAARASRPRAARRRRCIPALPSSPARAGSAAAPCFPRLRR